MGWMGNGMDVPGGCWKGGVDDQEGIPKHKDLQAKASPHSHHHAHFGGVGLSVLKNNRSLSTTL
jgi:hypothetical protein